MMQVKEKLRAVTFLSRQQIDFLDKLGKDAFFYEGKKLSRSHIISELVNFLMDFGISIKNINVADDTLAQELLKMVSNNHNHAEKNETKNAVA